GGQATFYNVEENEGACGGFDTNTDFVVAMAVGMYGDENSVSQYCGKTVQITNLQNGNTATATVVDCCPTCPIDTSLDMSPSLFDSLSDNNEDEGVFPISY
ncbi:hypothetical protein BOTBODRAFT_76664, partial [Botryobasidium botryosum FD-172 SS1]